MEAIWEDFVRFSLLNVWNKMLGLHILHIHSNSHKNIGVVMRVGLRTTVLGVLSEDTTEHGKTKGWDISTCASLCTTHSLRHSFYCLVNHEELFKGCADQNHLSRKVFPLFLFSLPPPSADAPFWTGLSSFWDGCQKCQ